MSKKIIKRSQETGIYLYVLEFKNGKFYVGITKNPEMRIFAHKNELSNAFVKENLSIINVNMQLLHGIIRSKALWIENDKTIELILKYGIERVCGGYIVGDLNSRKEKIQRFYNARKNNYKWHMEVYGNSIEFDVNKHPGIESIVEMINKR
ncbi:MAG: GIY-YIG nuclease family protein [Bacteroidales bacterium]|jgi:predicted GIY-YIG superfamily endonuclease|nr:GIY-YIG nuclease family protein [Bacteroidales bacterium]